MFVGHGLAAFALVGFLARWRGRTAEHALQLAVVAALFATVPDIDILYGPLGLLNGISGVFDAADSFWSTGNVVHRGPTHGMVLGAVAAAAFALWYRQGTVSSALGLCGFVLIVAIATVTSGSLAGAVVAAMTLSGLLILVLARRFGLSAAGVFATASVGLLSHPLGDLFTGEPPQLLYPFDVTLVGERIALSADPTLHLLGAFVIELSIIWLALIVYCRLTDRRVRSSIDRKAALGVGYAAAAVTLPAPTLDVSYYFVFSILVFGIIGATQRGLLRRRGHGFAWLRAFTTGLTAITVAATAYLVTYVAL